MNAPLVSIIMPAYNAERFIKQAIDSVIAQTYSNWELLVVNDGSTDATQSIVQQIAGNDSRIKLINQENKRLAGARNTALKMVAGEWVALLDADDLWHPAKLERQISTIDQHPDLDLVYTTGWVFHNDNLNDVSPYKIPPGNFSGAEMYNMLYRYNTIPVLSVLFKSEWIGKIGLQQEEVHCLEDWDYWLRMALAGARFYGLNEPLFYYRRHGQNMSANKIDMHYAQAVIWIKNYQPESIKPTDFRKAIISLYNYLLPLLIKANQRDKAYAIVATLKKVLPGPAAGYKWLVSITNGNTIVFFSLANSLYKKLIVKR